MSLLGQLHPQYGKKDTVGVLRDIDLVLGVGHDHPQLRTVFQQTRERAITILTSNPEQGTSLRNDIFRAKNQAIQFPSGELSSDDLSKLKGVDNFHFEYHRLILFRQELLRNPEDTLKKLNTVINKILDDYGVDISGIATISNLVSVTHGDNIFRDIRSEIATQFGHVGIIAYCEGLIAVGSLPEEVKQYATEERQKHESNKQNSMEYWNFTNIINLCETRKRIQEKEIEGEGKSFVLSDGAGNGFAQLGVIYEYVKNGGKIRSISGTSMGATIAIMIGKIGNNPEKIDELMHDLMRANVDGSMPTKLNKHENEMLEVFHNLRDKYGIGDTTAFNDLEIPVVVNAGRQYNGGEQEIVLGGSELVIPSILASMNVPYPHKNENIGALGQTPVHGVNMIDYAANERGNPTHWLELLSIAQKDIIDIDVGYSSENGGSPFIRRLFQRATIRDFFAKLRINENNGAVIDMPLESSEGYIFPPGQIERFFRIGKESYISLIQSKEGRKINKITTTSLSESLPQPQ